MSVQATNAAGSVTSPLAMTVSSGKAWLAGSDGAVYPVGTATSFGSMQAHKLSSPVVGMAATPDGGGYWLVASDGGIFNYGDAGFYGSRGGQPLNAPIVGMAATSDGGGYWLVASDGGIFNYGDAGFYGSRGGQPLNAPIVGMAATPDGGGYWLVASDGGVFTYGDAAFYGSAGGIHLNRPIVGVAATPDRGWLLAGGLRRRCLQLWRCRLLRFRRIRNLDRAGCRNHIVCRRSRIFTDHVERGCDSLRRWGGSRRTRRGTGPDRRDLESVGSCPCGQPACDVGERRSNNRSGIVRIYYLLIVNGSRWHAWYFVGDPLSIPRRRPHQPTELGLKFSSDSGHYGITDGPSSRDSPVVPSSRSRCESALLRLAPTGIPARHGHLTSAA